jgi:hypothetical protein
MISLGTVRFPSGTVAELRSDWTWAVTDMAGQPFPELAATITLLYRDGYAGPQDGAPGEAVLQDLARRMKGTAHYTGPGSAPAGRSGDRVY